jgi:hypothetical protein
MSSLMFYLTGGTFNTLAHSFEVKKALTLQTSKPSSAKSVEKKNSKTEVIELKFHLNRND